MRWGFVLSLSLFLSCPGLIQAPPATPGSNIPVISNSSPHNILSESNKIPSDSNLDKTILPEDRQWGVIICSDEEPWNTSAFNNSIREFLSTSVDPISISSFYIRCSYSETYKNWKGGFFIKGKIHFSGQRFNPRASNLQGLKPDSNSYIELHITTHLGRQLITPLKMIIVPLKSSITPSNITLVFKDQKGEISLSGSVKFNEKIKDFVLSGDLNFTNFTDWRGSKTTKSGFLGWFNIPLCSFLECSSQISLSKSLPSGL
ncbi:MAG: hypothetical protein GDA46_03265 [Bdellovibrionales bacterium]|nr:hypothetical protein [Bdellovibrionales bacterium]